MRRSSNYRDTRWYCRDTKR